MHYTYIYNMQIRHLSVVGGEDIVHPQTKSAQQFKVRGPTTQTKFAAKLPLHTPPILRLEHTIVTLRLIFAYLN